MTKEKKENKICTTISLNPNEMQYLDALVKAGYFDSRSAAVRSFIKEEMKRNSP